MPHHHQTLVHHHRLSVFLFLLHVAFAFSTHARNLALLNRTPFCSTSIGSCNGTSNIAKLTYFFVYSIRCWLISPPILSRTCILLIVADYLRCFMSICFFNHSSMRSFYAICGFFPVNNSRREKKTLSLSACKVILHWISWQCQKFITITADSYFWKLVISTIQFSTILYTDGKRAFFSEWPFWLFTNWCAEHVNLYVRFSPSPALNSYQHLSMQKRTAE